MGTYDSRKDTLQHIEMVKNIMLFFINKLERLSNLHDKSKLEHPEKKIFDIYTTKLKETTYGSDQYKEYLNKMSIGLKHHYEKNRHHPEHFENLINDMTLLDIIEMFCDWKAATKRHVDGDINKSIKINKERFKYDKTLENIFKNTVKFFDHFDMIEKLFTEEDNRIIRTIVYDWFNGESIYDYDYQYKRNFNGNEFNKANDIILTLVSMGFG
jgi:hypothetical protein